jgi:signal peptidase I
LTVRIKKLWKNEYVQTATVIGLIVLVFFGIWYCATVALNNPNPIVVVPSGSMCIPYGSACEGLDHPFDRTLHVGDLLVLQGLNPQDYKTNYPDSDIIVFHKASDPEELIVHRITAVKEIDGKLYFRTKGDGNPITKWPGIPDPSEYDGPNIEPPEGVPQDQVVGRVVMRIPWAGHVVLFMRTQAGLVVVVLLVALLIILEFIIPVLRKEKKTEARNRTD